MNENFKKLVDNLRTTNAEMDFRDSTGDFNELAPIVQSTVKNQAFDTADKLVKYFWENQNAPLRIGDMLEALGFIVILDDMLNDDTLSGALAINNSDKNCFRRMIILNRKDNVGHQRFTIAHELAHYIFDALPGQEYYEAYYRTDETKNNEIREYRANQFAANLLMPKSIFEPRYKYIASKISDPQTVQMLLSMDFGVSMTAVRRRLEELELGAS